MSKELQKSFLHLVRLGIGIDSAAELPAGVDWVGLKTMAEKQGLLAVALDGIGKLPENLRPAKLELLQWIGVSIQQESRQSIRQKAAEEMAQLFHTNGIRTYVLKGDVVAECYPKHEHRTSVDMDCFLAPDNGDFDAWSVGNDLIKAHGTEVECDYYKNSTFYLPGLMVENHRFLTPFRGNKRLATLEKWFQAKLRQDAGESRFESTWLYRPPVMVSALFLIEHAYSHFLHEGLTWRMVLDWMMFSRKHRDEIDWNEFDARIDEFGFRQFYDSYLHLGRYLLGELDETELSKCDRLMMDDIWADLDLHETVQGVRGKLSLVGNTWRARWKYSNFADISWLQALWIQVKGVLFEKEPKLN